MPTRRLTAAAALVGVAAGIWLAAVPYRQRISIGRLSLFGRCPAALVAALSSAPGKVVDDLGSDERLPAELCAPSARPAGAFALSLFAGALFVAGRTTWRPRR